MIARREIKTFEALAKFLIEEREMKSGKGKKSLKKAKAARTEEGSS